MHHLYIFIEVIYYPTSVSVSGCLVQFTGIIIQAEEHFYSKFCLLLEKLLCRIFVFHTINSFQFWHAVLYGSLFPQLNKQNGNCDFSLAILTFYLAIASLRLAIVIISRNYEI